MVKERLKNSLKVGEKKARLELNKNSSFSFNAFIVFIYLSGVSEPTILINKITNIDYSFEFISGHGQPFGHGIRRIIRGTHDSRKIKTGNHTSRKYPGTTFLFITPVVKGAVTRLSSSFVRLRSYTTHME